MENGQAETALAELARSVMMLDEALRREPAHVAFRGMLLRTHGMSGNVLERLGRFDDVVAARDKAVQASPTPREADYQRLFLAAACAQARQHARADEVMQDWRTRTTPATPTDQLCHCVEVYCTILRDLSQASSENRKLAEPYGVQAVGLLKTLEARGYFANPEQLRWLEYDLGLQPLRDRADFKELLRSVKRK
jgi:hypothetical protein